MVRKILAKEWLSIPTKLLDFFYRLFENFLTSFCSKLFIAMFCKILQCFFFTYDTKQHQEPHQPLKSFVKIIHEVLSNSLGDLWNHFEFCQKFPKACSLQFYFSVDSFQQQVLAESDAFMLISLHREGRKEVQIILHCVSTMLRNS